MYIYRESTASSSPSFDARTASTFLMITSRTSRSSFPDTCHGRAGHEGGHEGRSRGEVSRGGHEGRSRGQVTRSGHEGMSRGQVTRASHKSG